MNYAPQPYTPPLATGTTDRQAPAIQPNLMKPQGISPGVQALMRRGNGMPGPGYDNVGIQSSAMVPAPAQPVQPMQQFQNQQGIMNQQNAINQAVLSRPQQGVQPPQAPMKPMPMQQPAQQPMLDPNMRMRMAAFGYR